MTTARTSVELTRGGELGLAPANRDGATPSNRVFVVLGVAVGVVLLALANSERVGAILATLLVLLAPTSRRLDRRVALNIALLVGWCPFIFWVPPFLGPRTAAITVLTLGVVVTLTASWFSHTPLLPVVRGRDSLLFLSGALAALVASPMRSPGTPHGAMRMLTGGWDHASHFSMYVEQRLSLSSPPFMTGAADESGFFFQHYPQWFHSLLVLLSQMFFGTAGGVETELVRYTQLQWAMLILVVVLVTAAFVQAVPDSSSTAALTLAMLVVWSLLLGVPGALNLLQGHLSFLLAAGAPAVIFFLVTGRPGLTLPSAAAVVGLVTVGASWMLVLPLVLVAASPSLRSAWVDAGVRTRAALMAALVLSGVATTLLVAQSVGTSPVDHLALDGPVASVEVAATVALITVSGAAVAWRTRRAHDTLSPVRRLTPVALVGAAVAELAALAVFQHTMAGALSYYFWKVSLAVLLICTLVGTHAVVDGVARAQPRPAGRRTSGWVEAGVVVVVATLGLGIGLREYPAPSAWWAASLRAHLQERSDARVGGDVEVVLAASMSTSARDAASATLILTRPSDLSPAYGNQWFHALTRSRTVRAGELDDALYSLGLDRRNEEAAVEIARAALARADGRVAVTDPELLLALRTRLTASDPERVVLVRR